MLKGKVTFGKPQTNYRENDFMTIEIIDELSRTQFIEVEITFENFAKAILGMSDIDCVFETRGLDKVGLVREHKRVQVVVNFESYRQLTDEELQAAMKPYEVDGWQGQLYDMKNYKNYGGNENNRFCDVLFERWVEKEEVNGN